MASKFPSAATFLPAGDELADLAQAARACRGCDLYADATQTVFGAGPPGARVMLVGECPGDVEDRSGEPFVGPAGKLLDRALAAAGVDRSLAYVTNAVKHFRWKSTAGGQRRLHVTPGAAHVSACRPWLSAELAAVDPVLVVAMGATAAQSLFGPQFRVTRERGVLLDWPPAAGPYAGLASPAPSLAHALATIHPSAVLRGDPSEREQMFDGLVADLRLIVPTLS
jgi:uracil-DNA glycosylase family protein